MLLEILVSLALGGFQYFNSFPIRRIRLLVFLFLLSFLWGFYLWLKGGLDLDYASQEVIDEHGSWIYYIVGLCFMLAPALILLLTYFMQLFRKD